MNRDFWTRSAPDVCCIQLKPVPDEQVKKYLMEHVDIPDYQADICAAFAQGNIGKAERLATSEDFNAIKASAMKLIRKAGDNEHQRHY